MAYNYEYPYVDPNRYNSDWMLEKMKEIEDIINGIINGKIKTGEDIINVKSYGAKGDGETDDTTAIQKILNRFTGKPIFFPAGVYLITDTIIIPSNSFLVGAGIDSVILAGPNFMGDLLRSENYKIDNNIYDYNIRMFNFVIDGGFADFGSYIVKKPKSTQSGYCHKGNSFGFDKMIFRNCGGNGITLVDNVNRPLSDYDNAGTSFIINSKIMYNGYNGIENSGCVDIVIHNCDIHSNSRHGNNTGNNMKFNSGNAKISDTHFFSLYGYIKPYSSVFIGSDSGSVQFSNCHVEGAYNPAVIYGNRCFFENTRFFSSFGVCDLRIDGEYSSFVNCEFFKQVSDNNIELPTWIAAVIFEKNNTQKNNGLTFINCSIQQTKFTNSTENLGTNNRIEISGNGEIGAVDYSKAQYKFNGFFSDAYLQQESNKFGFPIAGAIGIFDMTGDINLSSTYNIVNSYTAGNLVLQAPIAGLLILIANKTAIDVPVTGQVNGISNYKIPNNKTVFLLGSGTQFYSIDL